MKRSASEHLSRWLSGPDRKPLVIRGARQVGKTWLVRDLAARHDLELIELNFERQPNLVELFESNDPKVILDQITRSIGRRILIPGSVLFLDEIQVSPELLAKLRWFYEELPELPVVAAGSLLDFVLAAPSFSVPVGRITYLHVEPLGFREWLSANDQAELVDLLDELNPRVPLPAAVADRLADTFSKFTQVGGMPAVVRGWLESGDERRVRQIQSDLLATYRDDFHKYSRRVEAAVLDKTLLSVARQLGSKFTYSQVSPELDGRKVKAAIGLLAQARVAHRVIHSAGNGVPLAAETNEQRFKAVLIDCGLIVALLAPAGFVAQEAVNKGAFAEQVVGQLLRQLGPVFREPSLHYWQRERGRIGEVDYLVEVDGSVVPVEVKSGAAGRMKSLMQFMADRQLARAVRFHDGPSGVRQVEARTTRGHMASYELISLPLWATEELVRVCRQLEANRG